jgi:hypothetical protein
MSFPNFYVDSRYHHMYWVFDDTVDSILLTINYCHCTMTRNIQLLEKNVVKVSNLHHSRATDFESVNSLVIKLKVLCMLTFENLSMSPCPRCNHKEKLLSPGFEPASSRRNRFLICQQLGHDSYGWRSMTLHEFMPKVQSRRKTIVGRFRDCTSKYQICQPLDSE